MQSHRIISGLTVLVMVVLVAAGWFLVAQPQLAAADTANQQQTETQSQIASTQATLVSLKNAQKNLPDLKKKLAALQVSIPSDIDSSAYIRGLDDLAAASGVLITGITVNDPTAYVAPVAPASTAPVPAASASPSPSPTASAAPAAPVPVAGWEPTTDALITSSNFVAIPVTVAVIGPWANDLAFTQGLQSGSRLFLVTALSTKQADDGANYTTEISGFIYALVDPKTAAAQAAAEKAASASPTPTPTATATATPNPSGSSTPTPTTSPTPTK